MQTRLAALKSSQNYSGSFLLLPGQGGGERTIHHRLDEISFV
jgi:hypothetical protein